MVRNPKNTRDTEIIPIVSQRLKKDILKDPCRFPTMTQFAITYLPRNFSFALGIMREK